MRSLINTSLFLFIFLQSFVVNSGVLFLSGGIPERIRVAEIKYFGYLVEGKGEYEDLMYCINKYTFKNGYIINWSEYPSNNIFNLVSKGELDIIFPMSYNFIRNSEATKSIPLVVSKDLLIYDIEIASFTDVELRAAARSGTTQMSYLSQMRYKDVMLSDDYVKLIELLNDRKVSLIAISHTAFKSVKNLLKIPVGYHVYNETEIGYYFNKKLNPVVVKDFNESIKRCS